MVLIKPFLVHSRVYHLSDVLHATKKQQLRMRTTATQEASEVSNALPFAPLTSNHGGPYMFITSRVEGFRVCGLGTLN